MKPSAPKQRAADFRSAWIWPLLYGFVRVFCGCLNNVFRLSDIGLGFPPTPPTPIKRFAQGVVNLNDFLEIFRKFHDP
jgi:hypothetical protein